MKLSVCLVLAATLAAEGALAAPLPAQRPKVFISPAGEPFRAGPGAPDPFKAWFDQADANRDGALDKAEFEADATRFFRRLDTNGDGVIDGFEEAAYERDIAPELSQEAELQAFGDMARDRADARARAENNGIAHIAGHGEAREPTQRPHPPAAIYAQLLVEPEPVSGADFDLDDHITLAEWMKATDARFALLDTARAGKLTYDQLTAWLAAQTPAQRKGRR